MDAERATNETERVEKFTLFVVVGLFCISIERILFAHVPDTRQAWPIVCQACRPAVSQPGNRRSARRSRRAYLTHVLPASSRVVRRPFIKFACSQANFAPAELNDPDRAELAKTTRARGAIIRGDRRNTRRRTLRACLRVSDLARSAKFELSHPPARSETIAKPPVIIIINGRSLLRRPADLNGPDRVTGPLVA